MEAAIRWSPHSTQQNPRFLIIDVAGNRLQLNQIESFEKNRVKYKRLCVRDNLPNFTAFDWSKRDENLVGLGSASGEAIIVQVDAGRPQSEFVHSFPIKHQRKCNSIAFSSKNFIATGLDRVRNDVCLNIYDLNTPNLSVSHEPYKKLASSEAISSIKFLNTQPDTLIAGVSRQCLRVYDLRDSGSAGAQQYPTRQVHNIAIDPLDDNYFVSAGPPGDPTVSVWDRRFTSRSTSGTPNDASLTGAVIEFRPVVDNSQNATIWSLRYCGTKRSTFGVLANTGEFRVIEMAQHSHRPEPHQNLISHQGAPSWMSPHYTKVSHTLKHSWYDERPRSDEGNRLLACDFMTVGSSLGGHCALGLFSNREVEVMHVPTPPPQIKMSALNEVFRNREVILQPSSRQGTVAEDLIDLQNKALSEKHDINPDPRDNLSGRLDRLTIDNPRQNLPLASLAYSSREMHEDLLTMAFPDIKLDLPDILKASQTQKRRCQEGYNLDTRKNKEIVANDPWLEGVWGLVERLDVLAWDNGMTGSGLDLSYLGVAAVWTSKLASYEQRIVDADTKPSKGLVIEAIKDISTNKEFPPFQGVQTSYPEHRQLCLAICGWNLSKKGLREKCMTLIDQGKYYKAIVLAHFKGYKDIALDLLRYCIQNKLLQNIGLAAVITCDSVTEEQRPFCSWMADETNEPYLKALLTYFISGDWTTVTEMAQLTLIDRVGCALKYLPDDQLTSFLKFAQAEAVAYGDISGLVLTGLSERALELLEHYIHKFSDLQTAVLLLARVCPLYIRNDVRWPLWKDLYLEQMQVWRTFLERTHFIKEHNLRSVNREKRSLSKPNAPSLSVRCMNCQQNLALRRDTKTQQSYLTPAASSAQPTPPNPSKSRFHGRNAQRPGLSCPNCGAQMPRCGLCMLWLGSPDPSKLGAAMALKEEDSEARLMVFCMNCTHGFHGHHARDWFARHATCPVPDCACMCGLLK